MSKKLNILQLNDVHGYINLHNETFYEPNQLVYRKCGGYARIATLLKEIRRSEPNSLLFDGGDTFHGTFPVVDTKGEILPKILNKLDISAMTGHWDFAYGPQQLQNLIAKLNYPFLAANVYDKLTDELVFQPTLVIEKSGIKIGVIGLACNIVDKTMPASFSEGIYFTDGVKELPIYIDRLKNKEQVDLVILLSHNGFPQEVELVKQNIGIDICLSSHTHNRVIRPFIVNDTIIIQSGSHGSFLGKLELDLDDNNKIISYAHQLIEVCETIEPDMPLQETIDNLLLPYQYLDRKIGRTITALNRNLSLECTLDNFLLKSMEAQVEADIYVSNGWRYGTPIPEGDITLNDLYNIVPMNPPIQTLIIRGYELLQLLEDNLDKTYNEDPLRQMGGYVKRAMGIKVYFRAENPKNSRIQFAFINNKPIEPNGEYVAAFITNQGVPEKIGKYRINTHLNIIDALKEYTRTHIPLKIDLYNTFELV